MTLKDIPLEERIKLTKTYPIAILGRTGSGKSASYQSLSDEDKKRTVVFNLENKTFMDSDESEYHTVIKFLPLDATPNDERYKDNGNVVYRTIDKINASLKAAIAKDDIDRVIIDSFSAYVDTAEREFKLTQKGFTIWTEYDRYIYDILQTIKNSTYVYGKFVYVIGHYTPDKDKSKDFESEKFMKVSGTKWHKLVEKEFNCCVEVRDHIFYADNKTDDDTTKVPRRFNPLNTSSNDISELEELLTSK
jgi:hypothetical protein